MAILVLLAVAASVAVADETATPHPGTLEWLAIDGADPIPCPAKIAGATTTERSSCAAVPMNGKSFRKHVRELLKRTDVDRHVSGAWRVSRGGRHRRLLVDNAYFDLIHDGDSTVAIVPISCLADDPQRAELETLELLPRTRQSARPAYPEPARITPTNGYAVVQVVIDPNGAPIDARVAGESPQGLGFGRSSIEAIRRSSFEPGEIDGVAVRSALTVSHVYTIR